MALTISPLLFLSALTAAALETLAWETTNSISLASTPVSSTGSSSPFLASSDPDYIWN